VDLRTYGPTDLRASPSALPMPMPVIWKDGFALLVRLSIACLAYLRQRERHTHTQRDRACQTLNRMPRIPESSHAEGGREGGREGGMRAYATAYGGGYGRGGNYYCEIFLLKYVCIFEVSEFLDGRVYRNSRRKEWR